jgi:hypothetical protein
MIAMNSGSCAKRHKRASAGDPCVASAAQQVIKNAGQDGPLNGLLLLPWKIPEFDIANLQPKIADVVQGTNTLLTYMKESAKELSIVLVGTRADSLARLVYWLVYARIVLGEVATMTDHIIPADYFSKDTESKISGECHDSDRIPFCSNCGGNLPLLVLTSSTVPICFGVCLHSVS